MKVLLRTAVCLLFMTGTLSAVIVERIKVKINDEIVTTYDITVRVNEMISQYRRQKKRIPYNIRKKALNDLIDEKLIFQKAKKEGVVVNRLEVEDSINKKMRVGRMNLKKLKRQLAKEGMSYDKFFMQIKKQLTVQKLYSKYRKDQKQHLSDAEIRKYYLELKPEEYKIYHMFVPVSPYASFTARAKSEKKIKRIQELLKKNKWNFLNIGRYNGARVKDFGYIQPKPDIPKYLYPIFNKPMNIGKYKEFRVVNEIPGFAGYHVVFLRHKRLIALKKVRRRIVNYAYSRKMEDAIDMWVRTLRKDAVIVINR